MKHRVVTTAILTFTAALLACTQNSGTGKLELAKDGRGKLAFKLGTAEDDLSGFRFVVTDPDGQEVASKYAELAPGHLPTWLLPGAGDAHRLADHYFVLRGNKRYYVQAFPMLSEQEPSQNCAPTEKKLVSVTARETTEVVLISQCRTPENGGLDIVAVINYGVTITDLVFDPLKFIDTCQDLVVKVTATDDDNDPLTYKWEIVSTPDGVTEDDYSMSFDEATMTFHSKVKGSYQAKVTVCDPFERCTSLTFPIHVSECERQCGSRLYTLDADFDEGQMVGVGHEIPDQLQLNEETNILPFIWVANSGEHTVSKIDTVTGRELGRYRTGPGGENPSRTTVDSNGDLWVGNRNRNTATKIALYPTDQNGDGIIQTSQDLNNNGLIEPGEVLPWGQDEAILLHINVDAGPRALAIDASNNVWIGGTGGNMGKYNGQTGAQLKNIPVGRTCYGALIDANGTLWVSNDGHQTLTRIDDPSGTHAVTIIPTGDGWVYGIGIDQAGFIYASGWSNNRLRKYDPAANAWVYSVSIPGGGSNRGVAVGLDGDVWVAHSGTHRVTRHNAADGSVKATIPVGSTPTGVATDAAGKIWVTNYGSSNIMRIDPATNSVDFTQGTHTNPYNYSDMTGIISRNITTKKGDWTIVYDEGAVQVCGGMVTWTADTPADSTLKVFVSTSADGSTWSAEQEVSDGVAFTAAAPAQYIKAVAKFASSTADQLTPILYDLTIEADCDCN